MTMVPKVFRSATYSLISFGLIEEMIYVSVQRSKMQRNILILYYCYFNIYCHFWKPYCFDNIKH